MHSAVAHSKYHDKTPPPLSLVLSGTSCCFIGGMRWSWLGVSDEFGLSNQTLSSTIIAAQVGKASSRLTVAAYIPADFAVR